MVDGAGYHRSKATREYFKKTGMKVILLAPYNYNGNCIELVWSYLKRVPFNYDQIKTSKK